MKKALKAIGKTVKLIFIVFCFFLLSLCFRQQRLPGSVVDWICEKCSGGDRVVSCESVTVGLPRGVCLEGLRVYDRARRDNLVPVVSADEVSVWPILRRVRVVAAKMPRLHDAYYGIAPAAGSVRREEPFDLAALRLPEIQRFTLELLRPEILGVAPESVRTEVEVRPRRLALDGVELRWPDQDTPMRLDGDWEWNLGRQRLSGRLCGTARQEHIRPLLKALDLPSSYPYMGGYPDTGTSGFTEVPGPVPVAMELAYDFARRDFRLQLDLHPEMGRYNDVRLQRVDGKLGVRTHFNGRGWDYDVDVGPLVAPDLHGRRLEGWLGVHGTNGLAWLEFDASSSLAKQDTLDIIGYLNRGTLDLFDCETPPRVTSKGVFNCDDVNIANNDLAGRVEVERCKMLDQPFTGLSMDYRLKGGEIVFTNYTGRCFSGGEFTGWGRFHLPIANGDPAGFHGGGAFRVKNGRIATVPLFLALTDALADSVPGVDRIVNQSESQCEFTLSNGVFRTSHFVVQGALFCIKLTGTCDLTTGELDMLALCTFMKEESLLGKYLIQPVLWPFTKLFTEFRVTGSKDRPKLTNTSVNGIGGFIKKVFD